MSSPPSALVLTGERTLPGVPDESYWFARHEVAYRRLAPFTTGARVLEAGCGEGYGAALLHAEGARTLLALDADPQVSAHVRVRYPHLGCVRGDLQQLPLRDGAVDVVTTLQTIEHLTDQERFLAECARVLRPSGTLILTTPNRLTFSPGRAAPLNPFHTRELSVDELLELLAPHFDVTRVRGVHHGARLRRWERRHGSLVDAQLATSPDQWSPGLRRLVRSVRWADFDLTSKAVDASLDLAVVAVRRAR